MSDQKNEETNAQSIAESPKIEETEAKPEPQPEQQDNDLQKLLQERDDQIKKLCCDLEIRTEERENYKNKIASLESEIEEMKKKEPNMLTPAQQEEIEKIKRSSEHMLIKAKGIIYDKTKICKNQELQIEALSQQVSSLKDCLGITKNLLEIRNVEIKHLQDKMDCMDIKISAERQRQDLLCKKMEAMGSLNATLREEYEKQLVMFEEMRNRYENDI